MFATEMGQDALRSVAAAPQDGLEFIVLPDRSEGWLVVLDGVPFERQHFEDRGLAVCYAKDWAADNRPSSLVVLDEIGSPTERWAFE